MDERGVPLFNGAVDALTSSTDERQRRRHRAPVLRSRWPQLPQQLPRHRRDHGPRSMKAAPSTRTCRPPRTRRRRDDVSSRSMPGTLTRGPLTRPPERGLVGLMHVRVRTLNCSASTTTGLTRARQLRSYTEAAMTAAPALILKNGSCSPRSGQDFVLHFSPQIGDNEPLRSPADPLRPVYPVLTGVFGVVHAAATTGSVLPVTRAPRFPRLLPLTRHGRRLLMMPRPGGMAGGDRSYVHLHNVGWCCARSANHGSATQAACATGSHGRWPRLTVFRHRRLRSGDVQARKDRREIRTCDETPGWNVSAEKSVSR